MSREADPVEVLKCMLSGRPKFHGQTNAGTQDYAIEEPVLRWILDHAPAGGQTLETGCGYTTIAFALRSSRHTAISPFPGEHELIRRWCADNGVPTVGIEFIAAPSQRVVPQITGRAFDMVLIDGDHAFPAPFIDWYYTAEMVKQNGYVLVDDTQLVTGKILRDFLLDETGRWVLDSEIGKTAIFRRVTASPVVEGLWWGQQPYVKDLSRIPPSLKTRAIRKFKRVVLRRKV